MIDGLVIDSFAGGGGASTGIEAALGRPVDVAINHDPEAVAMHLANHPGTRHYCRNVWQADPREVVREAGGGPVALAWFSPDCKHFSKAKGGKPVARNIRDLAWVVILWAKRVRPRVIMLENVEEFRTWGPLGADGKPCPERKGQTFKQWVGELRRLGYKVEHRELRACDYGAPTIRKRLFLVARCDGLPIVWPEPTHGPGRLPYRTAAEIIDWSVPCPSIFSRARPLAEATCRRIARGVQRYVIDAARPFIVPITHVGDDRVHGLDEPLRTITTAHRGELALCAPTLVQTGYGEREGQAPRVPGLDKPLGTVVAGGLKHALVAAFLAQHNTGVTGHAATVPVSTITSRGTQQGLAAVHLTKFKGTCPDGQAVDDPLATVQAEGQHHGVVSAAMVGVGGRASQSRPRGVDEPLATLTAKADTAVVAAFMQKYYGTGGQLAGCDEPFHTLTAKARMGVVTVTIDGEPYAIVDIGLRMLTPRELFRAQGFPDSYVIDPMVDGKPLTKTAQIRCCGNSVCPPLAEALVRANVGAAAGIEVAA